VPTYDYRCDSCKKTYELRESFSAPMEHTCEKCGKGTAKRLLSAPRIVFKGSGWYATDSRGKQSATADNDGSSGESSSDKPEKKSKKESAAASASKSSGSSSSSSTETASAAS
jgi:putative FmdB family regulatory protein